MARGLIDLLKESQNFQSILHLEKELSYLGGMCASSLIKKDIVLPAGTVEEQEEDIDLVEEGAQLVG